MIPGQFIGYETRHWRLAAKRQEMPGDFTSQTEGSGSRKADTAFDTRDTQCSEQRIDPLPKCDGLVVGDEVGATADCSRIEIESGLCREVCVNRIFDMDHVHAVVSAAHYAEPAAPGPGKKPGDEMGVADSPDQVGPQGNCSKTPCARFKHLALRDCLRQWIGTGAVLGQGKGLVCGCKREPVVHHTGRTGVYETADAVPATAVEEGTGSQHIDSMKLIVAPPDPDTCSDMENRPHTCTCRLDGIRVGE